MKNKSTSEQKRLMQLRAKALASISPEDRLLYQCFGSLEQEIQKKITEIQSIQD